MRAIAHFPRLFQIEQSSAEAVDESVTARENAVIDHQPAFDGLDRDRPRADLRALPATIGFHHMPMLTPMDHVRALRDEDITKGGMPIVAGPAEHHVLAVD